MRTPPSSPLVPPDSLSQQPVPPAEKAPIKALWTVLQCLPVLFVWEFGVASVPVLHPLNSLAFPPACGLSEG